MKLSLNFQLNEFSYSKTAIEYGIDNTPDRAATMNLKKLCTFILQPLRDHIGKPVRISSGYRCKEVNALVGGSNTSKHLTGQASDIWVEGMSSFELAKTIINLNLEFHQLIIYPTFVHVSFVKTAKPKRQLLYSKDYSGPQI